LLPLRRRRRIISIHPIFDQVSIDSHRCANNQYAYSLILNNLKPARSLRWEDLY
jgi:hypothetical protein